MKALIIAQKEFAYKDGKFVGGIQKVEADQVEALTKAGVDVSIFLPSDTDKEMFGRNKRVTVVRSGSESQDQKTAAEKAKSTRARQDDIKKLLRSTTFDVVIVHDWSVSIHNLFLNEFKHVPSVVYLHNMPVDSGGIQMFNRIDTYVKLFVQGSVCAIVSDTCRTQWDVEIGRKIASEKQSKLLKPETIENYQKIGKEVFDVVWPGMVEKTYLPMESPRRFATMISRLNPNKRIDLAAKIADEIGIELFLFCPSPKNEEQQAIIESFKKYHHERNIFMDADREIMMSTLRQSSLQIIPSVESFSLVALEANACGVPCLIVDRGYPNSPHEACQENDEFNISYDTRMPKAERETYLKQAMLSIPLHHTAKRVIADRCHEFYSTKAVGERLIGVINRAIDRKALFNSTEEDTDEGVFAFG